MTRRGWTDFAVQLDQPTVARVDALLDRLRAMPGTIRPPMTDLTRADLLQTLVLRGLDEMEERTRR